MIQGGRERYRVDVINLPRLPLPEVVNQLQDLMKLVDGGWALRLFDDVPKTQFVFVAFAKSGLRSQVAVPYEYITDLFQDERKEQLRALWNEQADAGRKITALLMMGLTSKAQEVERLQKAGVFSNGEK
jgi:hypothetical protein